MDTDGISICKNIIYRPPDKFLSGDLDTKRIFKKSASYFFPNELNNPYPCRNKVEF